MLFLLLRRFGKRFIFAVQKYTTAINSKQLVPRVKVASLSLPLGTRPFDYQGKPSLTELASAVSRNRKEISAKGEEGGRKNTRATLPTLQERVPVPEIDNAQLTNGAPFKHCQWTTAAGLVPMLVANAYISAGTQTFPNG